MGKVSFVAGGGANSIGGSFYVLKVGDINIGLEFGANLGGWEGIEPVHSIVPHLDYLLLSHAHFDHIGLLPIAFRKFPGVKIFATATPAVFNSRGLTCPNIMGTILKPGFNTCWRNGICTSRECSCESAFGR